MNALPNSLGDTTLFAALFTTPLYLLHTLHIPCFYQYHNHPSFRKTKSFHFAYNQTKRGYFSHLLIITNPLTMNQRSSVESVEGGASHQVVHFLAHLHSTFHLLFFFIEIIKIFSFNIFLSSALFCFLGHSTILFIFL